MKFSKKSSVVCVGVLLNLLTISSAQQILVSSNAFPQNLVSPLNLPQLSPSSLLLPSSLPTSLFSSSLASALVPSLLSSSLTSALASSPSLLLTAGSAPVPVLPVPDPPILPGLSLDHTLQLLLLGNLFNAQTQALNPPAPAAPVAPAAPCPASAPCASSAYNPPLGCNTCGTPGGSCDCPSITLPLSSLPLLQAPNYGCPTGACGSPLLGGLPLNAAGLSSLLSSLLPNLLPGSCSNCNNFGCNGGCSGPFNNFSPCGSCGSNSCAGCGSSFPTPFLPSPILPPFIPPFGASGPIYEVVEEFFPASPYGGFSGYNLPAPGCSNIFF